MSENNSKSKKTYTKYYLGLFVVTVFNTRLGEWIEDSLNGRDPGTMPYGSAVVWKDGTKIVEGDGKAVVSYLAKHYSTPVDHQSQSEKGWNTVLYRQNGNGDVEFKLPGAKQAHFTLHVDKIYPRMLIFLLAPILKNLGFDQGRLQQIFPKETQPVAELPGDLSAPKVEEVAAPGDNGSGDVELKQEEGELVVVETGEQKKKGKGK